MTTTIKEINIAHFIEPFVFEYNESGKVVSIKKDYPCYNEKRYGAPKLSRVGVREKKFPSGKIEYRLQFEDGQQIGKLGNSGMISIHAHSDFYAISRKDNRGNNSYTIYFDKSGVEKTEKEVYEACVERLKNKKAAASSQHPAKPIAAQNDIKTEPAFELSAPVASEQVAAQSKKSTAQNPAERAEIARASHAAAESFVLGGDPLDNLTGQTAFLF